MRILNSCCSLPSFQLPTLGVHHPNRINYSSTAIQRDIRAALHFCSCELRCRRTECLLLPCINPLPDIFAVMNCYVLGAGA